MRDKLNLQLLILLLVFSIILLTISGRGCSKRGKETKIGSSNEWAGIAAPSSLTATAFSSSEIRLSWQDNSNNEDGFEIERSINGMNYELLTTVNANTVSYSDITNFVLIVYYYRIRAFNSIGDRSNWSNSTSVIFNLTGAWLSVCAGEEYTIALITDGSLWGWGDNQYGQLGMGDSAPLSITNPTVLGTDTDWSRIGTGYYHTLAIKNNGTLWSFGGNNSGQLGIGYTSDYIVQPTRVGTDSDWSTVTGGANHTLALKTNQTLWSWGYNNYGQLGLGYSGDPSDPDDPNNYVVTPSQIGTDSDWFYISTGSAFSFGMKTNNSLWAWGINSYGQLGIGDTDSVGKNNPTQIGTDSDYIEITASYLNVFSKKSNGNIWRWGDSIYSPTQVGTGSDWLVMSGTNISVIDAGGAESYSDFVLAVKSNGTIWSWGTSFNSNQYGQLGFGNTINMGSPTQIGNNSNWLAVTAGGSHSIARTTNGMLYIWGRNNYGQLGFGDTVDSYIPRQLASPLPPNSLSLIIDSSSQISLYWVDNSNNESGFKIERKIGITGTWSPLNTVPVNTTLYNDATITTGTAYYYRVRAYNIFGDSPYSNISYTIVSGNWAAIASGKNHTIARKTNNTIWSWGSNYDGQLGLSDSGFGTERMTPTQIGTDLNWDNIAAGGYTSGSHTIAHKTDGTIWSWGYNQYGQLGLEDTANRASPVQISSGTDWLGVVSGTNISAIAAGGYHTVACKSDKTLWSWGYNNLGQLGLGDTNINRNTPTQIGTLSDWSVVATGYQHTAAVKTNFTLWVWGRNDYYQLGLGNTATRKTPAQVGSDSDWSLLALGEYHTISLKTNKTIWAWGYNNKGQLGDGTITNRLTPRQIGTASDWVTIVSGFSHVIAGKTNGTIWSWGYNGYGQLGVGDTLDRKTPSQVDSNSDWNMITAGYNYTIGYKTNRTLWSWGYNENGQLGLGDTIDRNVPTLVGE